VSLYPMWRGKEIHNHEVPKIGFLPLDIESLYLTHLTNAFLKFGIKRHDDNQEAPY